jgi:hypothetical protein
MRLLCLACGRMEGEIAWVKIVVSESTVASLFWDSRATATANDPVQGLMG